MDFFLAVREKNPAKMAKSRALKNFAIVPHGNLVPAYKDVSIEGLIRFLSGN